MSKHRSILLILLLAAVVRAVGTAYGLPNLYNSDEPFNVINALAFGAKKSLEPTYFVYPAFYSYVLAGIYGLYFAVGRLAGAFANAIDFGASYFIDPTGIFLTGRLLSVFLGVATVWLVYLIGARFFSKRTALLAALLLTASAVHTDLSHWILLEAPVACMSALALYFIFSFKEVPSGKRLLLAGLACGLAISTKYNAGFLILALWLTVFHSGSKPLSALLKKLSLATLSAIAGFLFGSPYWLLAPGRYLHDLSYTAAHVSAGMVGHLSAMPVVWPLWELVFNDLTVGLIFVAGALSVLFGGDRKQAVLAAFALPTLLFVGLWNRSGVHYLLPVFPALALLGAGFLQQILRPTWPRLARVGICVLILAAPLAKIGLRDFRLTRPDSRTQARKWIETHIPPNTPIAYENYVYGPNLFDPGRFMRNSAEAEMLPLAIKEKLVQESLRRPSYRLINLRKDFRLKALANADSLSAKNSYARQLVENRLPRLASIKKSGIPYLMISSDNYDRYFTTSAPPKNTPVWLSYQNGRHFYESIFKSRALRPVKEFRPGKWNLGPTIRLYRFAK